MKQSYLIIYLIALLTAHTSVFSAPLQDSEELVAAAKSRLNFNITYDGRYQKISYPMGDVSPDIGVCTDVVIRSYRKIGIDLQELVHLDMKENFSKYPKIWGLNKTDSNIDHRRVPNLETFFKRKGTVLTISTQSEDYKPGDIVSWRLGNKLPHIGIVSDVKDLSSGNYKIVHNIGAGPKLDDMLFDYTIVGHYRF